MIVGLVLGIILGGVIAAVLVQGLGMPTFPNPAFAYLAAAATGVITGLVAGKPIWSADGKIEAGLKAFFGALLGLGAMIALRSWAKVDLDLSMLKAGHEELGKLPAASLPVIAALLAGFYEIDNSPSDADDAKDADAKGRVGASKKSSSAKVRVADDDADDEGEHVEEPAANAKKKGR